MNQNHRKQQVGVRGMDLLSKLLSVTLNLGGVIKNDGYEKMSTIEGALQQVDEYGLIEGLNILRGDKAKVLFDPRDYIKIKDNLDEFFIHMYKI